jgi:hypothetical protein
VGGADRSIRTARDLRGDVREYVQAHAFVFIVKHAYAYVAATDGHEARLRCCRYCTMRYLDTAHGKTRSTQEMYRKVWSASGDCSSGFTPRWPWQLSRDLEVIQKAISLASQGNHASWEALMHRGYAGRFWARAHANHVYLQVGACRRVSDDVEETLPLDRSSASKHIKPSAPYIVAHGISLRHSAEMSPYVNLDYGHVLDVRLNAENLCHVRSDAVSTRIVFTRVWSAACWFLETHFPATRDGGGVHTFTGAADGFREACVKGNCVRQVTKRDGGFASERETLSGIQRLCGELSPYSQLRTVAAHILHEATCILSCLYAREAIFDCRFDSSLITRKQFLTVLCTDTWTQQYICCNWTQNFCDG